jgi:hypothetical protein
MTEQELLQHVAAAAQRLRAALQIEPLRRETVFAAVDACLTELAATKVWGQANRLPSGKLWEIAGEWLQHGALLHRARFKPRGYAGDFEMLGQICDYWCCDHPLGNLLDHYFQEHAAPKAVRHRTRIVADAIASGARAAGGEFHVASIGSGPAMDLVWAAEALSPQERARLRVSLFDLDPHALAAAKARLKPLFTAQQVEPVRVNLYRLPKLEPSPLRDADLIACTGFFDYLNEADATALLAALWQKVRAAGRLLVFNFAPHNPSRGLMEWIGNWYLIYRDEQAMRGLAARTGIGEDCEIKAEAEGIDLYIDARR